jgi:hypothetical protein
MLRASSLPALAVCPCFDSGPADASGTEQRESGTDRHSALRRHFEGDDSLLVMLPEEEREGVTWAAEYIRVHANTIDHALDWETPCEVILPDYTLIPGTTDAKCGIDLFDLKWRHADYQAQMALYALARIEEFANRDVEVKVHILYGCFQRAEILKFDYATALALVQEIASAHNNPEKQPSPCSYCTWCSNRLTCAALNDRVQAVAAGREDWKLENYHASEITHPTQMAKALTLSRHLRKWCDAVDYHAREMVVKNGVSIPGFELKSKPGRGSCSDMVGAFQASQLTSEEFLQCCDIRMTTSKDNPEKKGLAEIYAIKKGIPKSAAQRELKRVLQPYMRTPKEVLYLKPTNSTEEDQ